MRFLPEPFDTPVEADYALSEIRRHANEVEDITRDPRVDAPCNPPPLCRCSTSPCDPHCWGHAFQAAYEAANKRGAA